MNFEAHRPAFFDNFGSHFDNSLGILVPIFHGISAFSYGADFLKVIPANG